MLTLLLACTDYNIANEKPDSGVPEDTAALEDTDTGAGDTGAEETGTEETGTEETGELEQSYCTDFSDFDAWSYNGEGDWHIEDGHLREGRAGLYDAIAWYGDVGQAERFRIEVSLAWTGGLNDQSGIAWAIDGTSAWVVRWDDPQGDYSRYDPPGSIDVSWCEAGACTVVASNSSQDLYVPADKTFARLEVSVDGEAVTVSVDGATALQATVPGLSGPGVVGLYSNDNDGGVWFDDFCVWTG